MSSIADAMQQIVGVPYQISVIVLTVVALIYLVTSGYWGVATTDVIQGITITLAIVLLAAVTLREAGGLGPIVNHMAVNYPKRLEIPGELSWSQIFSYAWVWALIAFGQPQLVTKFMGLKDCRTMGTVVRTSIIWMSVFMILSHIVGVGALYLFEGRQFGNPDLLAPTMASEFGGSLVAGVFMCGALAAGLSTLVALVLSSSAAIAKDIYEDYRIVKGRNVDTKKSVKISRIATALVLLVVMALSLQPWDLVWFLSTMAAGALGAAFTAPMLLGLYWKKSTTAGCISSMVGGAATSVIWYALGLTEIVHSFVPGMIVSFILFVVVSRVTAPLPQSQVDLFFKKKCDLSVLR